MRPQQEHQIHDGRHLKVREVIPSTFCHANGLQLPFHHHRNNHEKSARNTVTPAIADRSEAFPSIFLKKFFPFLIFFIFHLFSFFHLFSIFSFFHFFISFFDFSVLFIFLLFFSFFIFCQLKTLFMVFYPTDELARFCG